jgi:hypothetical protein
MLAPMRTSVPSTLDIAPEPSAPLSDHELVKRLNAVSAKVRKKKLNFAVWDRARLSVLSHDRQHTGRLQHFYTIR